jgi:GntR family transcriptional regulator
MNGFVSKLDLRSGVPVYRQIIDQVLGGISTGVLKPGDQLPTVRQLAVDLAINPNTVVRAYRELEIREVLATQQGTGTFITDKKIEKNEIEHQRRVAQLAGELLARAGADGITLQELIDYFSELQKEQNRRA